MLYGRRPGLAVLAVILVGCGEPSTEPTPPAAALPAARVEQLVVETRAQLHAGQPAAAVQSARKGLSLDSTHADLNNLLATAAAALGRYDEAIGSVQRALRHHPDYTLGHLNLGGIYLRLQRFEEAETHLRRAAALEPGQPSLHRRLADLLRQTGRPELAVDAMRKAVALLPGEAVFAYLLGVALEQSGALPEAVEAYRQATQLDLSFAAALQRLVAVAGPVDPQLAAQAAQRLQRLQTFDAEAAQRFTHLRQAILNSPEDPSQHYRLGLFLLEQQRVEEGVNQLWRAAELQPADARLLNHIGGVLTRQQRFDDALGFYLRAADVDSTDVTALLNAGSALAVRGDVEGALPLYRRAMARQPRSLQVHYFLGLALANSGQVEEARQVLSTGVELGGSDEIAAQMDKVLAALPEEVE